MKHLLTSANRTDTAPPRHIGPQQRAVRALATVLVPSTLATLLLLDARQPGAEPEASGREVPSFVLAALPGEDEHTVLALRTEPMST